MTRYTQDVELTMVTFFLSLREKDRRRYAAVEGGPAVVEDCDALFLALAVAEAS